MKNLKTFLEFQQEVKEVETGDYIPPKFVIRPADDDTGYDLLAKEYGADPAPKAK